MYWYSVSTIICQLLVLNILLMQDKIYTIQLHVHTKIMQCDPSSFI